MTRIPPLPLMWLVDYGPARERALRWLGDRYLLAVPINRPRASGGFGSPPSLLSTDGAFRNDLLQGSAESRLQLVQPGSLPDR